MSIISGRNFLQVLELVDEARSKEPASWRSFDRGGADKFSLSTDNSLPEPSALEVIDPSIAPLRFLWYAFCLGGGFAHSGTGYSRSNCCRSRLAYSMPLTKSSSSVSRSLRSRGLDASDTMVRSSSLSTHAISPVQCLRSLPAAEDLGGVESRYLVAERSESRKNS